MPQLLVRKIFEELVEESYSKIRLGQVGAGQEAVGPPAYDDHVPVALIGEFVLHNHPLGRDLAQEAALRAVVVPGLDRPKVRIIALSLHGIAAVAEGPKVAQVIGAGLVPRDDMLYLKGLLLGPDSA